MKHKKRIIEAVERCIIKAIGDNDIIGAQILISELKDLRRKNQ